MSWLEVVPPSAAGDHAYLNACLTTDGEGGDPVAGLGEPGRLARVVDRFAATLPGADRRAIGSMWWQYYASQLLVPAIALRTRGVTVDPHGSTSALICEAGLARGFRIGLASGPHRPDAIWLRSFVATHLHPIVAALKQVTGVSRHVLWSDAARRLQRLRMSDAALDRDGLGAFVDKPVIAGVANPLCRRRRDGRPGVCCLRDRLPGYVACSDCPSLRVCQQNVRPSGDSHTLRT